MDWFDAWRFFKTDALCPPLDKQIVWSTNRDGNVGNMVCQSNGQRPMKRRGVVNHVVVDLSNGGVEVPQRFFRRLFHMIKPEIANQQEIDPLTK